MRTLIKKNINWKISQSIILFTDSSRNRQKKLHTYQNIKKILNYFLNFFQTPSIEINQIEINQVTTEYTSYEDFTEKIIPSNTNVNHDEEVEPQVNSESDHQIKHSDDSTSNTWHVTDSERLEIIREEFQILMNEYKRPYFFDGFQTKGAYICVKTPKDFDRALNDYWHMIWKQLVFTIVLVNDNLSEPFWPTEVNETFEFNNGYSIQNTGIENQKHYTITTLNLTNSNLGNVRSVNCF